MVEPEQQAQLDAWIDQCLDGRSFSEEQQTSIADFFAEVAGDSLLSSDWPGIGEEESKFRFHSQTVSDCIEQAIEAVLEDAEDDLDFDLEYAVEKFREFMLSSDPESVGNTYFALELRDSVGRAALLICRNEYFWQGGCEDTALTICANTEEARKYLASSGVIDAISYPQAATEVFTGLKIAELIEYARKDRN